jgi:hypothetical protein
MNTMITASKITYSQIGCVLCGGQFVVRGQPKESHAKRNARKNRIVRAQNGAPLGGPAGASSVVFRASLRS